MDSLSLICRNTLFILAGKFVAFFFCPNFRWKEIRDPSKWKSNEEEAKESQ